MSYSMNNLPDSFKRCMERGAKKALGKAGLTMQEIEIKNEAQSEKVIQKQIIGWLRIQGYFPNFSRMDKPKTDQIGIPDIHISCLGRSVYFEVKSRKARLTNPQMRAIAKLTTFPNEAKVFLVRDLPEVIRILDEFKQKIISQER
jgi:hypothetical protein